MCAFQVCRKQCCILHFRARTWENPCKPYLSKASKMYRHTYLFILCSTASWGLFYKHRVRSLQVSNYRSSRAWCDQSNKIDRVRRAKRFHFFNSFVRLAKLRPIGSQITGLQFEGWRTQRKKFLRVRFWNGLKAECENSQDLFGYLIFLSCRFPVSASWSLESHSKEPTHWNLSRACSGGRQSLVQDGQGRPLSNATQEPSSQNPARFQITGSKFCFYLAALIQNSLSCSRYRSYGCVIHPWVHRHELGEATTEVTVYKRRWYEFEKRSNTSTVCLGLFRCFFCAPNDDRFCRRQAGATANLLREWTVQSCLVGSG